MIHRYSSRVVSESVDVRRSMTTSYSSCLAARVWDDVCWRSWKIVFVIRSATVIGQSTVRQRVFFSFFFALVFWGGGADNGSTTHYKYYYYYCSWGPVAYPAIVVLEYSIMPSDIGSNRAAWLVAGFLGRKVMKVQDLDSKILSVAKALSSYRLFNFVCVSSSECNACTSGTDVDQKTTRWPRRL